MTRLEKILLNLNAWWNKNILIEFSEECMLTFPFVDKNNNRVVLYLTLKSEDSFTIGVILENPPAKDVIKHGCSIFKKDEEVENLYTTSCSFDRLSMSMTDAICLPIVYN